MTATIDAGLLNQWESVIYVAYLASVTASFVLYAPSFVGGRALQQKPQTRVVRLAIIASKALIFCAESGPARLVDPTGPFAAVLCWSAALFLTFPQYAVVFQSQVALYIGIILEILFDALVAPQLTMFFHTPSISSMVTMSMVVNLVLLAHPPPDLEAVAQSQLWSFTMPIQMFRNTTICITRETLDPGHENANPAQQLPDEQYVAAIEEDLLALQTRYRTGHDSVTDLSTSLLSLLLQDWAAVLFTLLLFIALSLSQALFLLNTLNLFSLSVSKLNIQHVHFVFATIVVYTGMAVTIAKFSIFAAGAAQRSKRGILALGENILGLLALLYTIGTIPCFILAIGIGRNMYNMAEPFRVRKNQQAPSDLAKEIFVATKEMIGSLVPLKMMGLEDVYFTKIQRLKAAELLAWTDIRIGQKYHAVEYFFILGYTTLVLLLTMIWKSKVEGISIMTTAPVAAVLFYRAGNTMNLMMDIRALPRIQSSLQQIDEFLSVTERTESRQFTKADITSNAPIIKIEGLTCRLNGGTDVPFNKLDLSLKAATVSVLRGPSASGKTALMESILGEIDFAEGNIEMLDSATAYCGQDVWLQTTSMKCNIIGASDVDNAWYALVVEACDLQVEFDKFPQNDSTIICTNAINLGLGQKMKIALARAIYSKAPILLLDDVFSVFDNAMALNLADRLFSRDNGFLRQHGTTVVLAAQAFPTPALVDAVYDIKHDGASEISQQSLMLASTSSTLSLQGRRPQEQVQPPMIDYMAAIPARYNQLSTMQLLRFVLKAFLTKKAFFIWASLLCFSTTLEWCIEATIWTDAQLLSHSLYYSLTWLAMGILLVIANFYEMDMFKLKLVPQYVQSAHDKMLEAMLWSSAACNPTNSSEVDTTMTEDMFAATRQLPTHIAKFLCTATALTIYFGIIASVIEYSVYSVIAAAIILYIVQKVFITASQAADKLSAAASIKLKSNFSNVIDGLTYINNLKWNKQIWRQLLTDLKASQKADNEKLRLDPWLSMAVDLIVAGIMLSLSLSLTMFYDRVNTYTISLGILTICKFQATTVDLMQHLLGLATKKESLSRMEYFYSNFKSEELREAVVLPERWGEDASIEFNRAVIGNHAPITGIAIPGRSVTIRGRSGSGKSRVLLALLSLVPYEGSIKIAGQEVREIPPRELRKHISTITQEPFDLPGTVEDNLFLYKLRNPEITGRVWDQVTAFLLAQIGILDALGDYYDAPFSQLHLSYGQRQGVNIARTALHKFQTSNFILFMDDACGRLNHETAAVYQQVVRECFFGNASIMVKTADCDLVVDGLLPLPEPVDPYTDPFA
ncbi:hypothetical protein VHEMI04591 [[Torrubiella] hemipterigena]|uniref:ABC transporter domain-containing protein n=1 Tax=[Torrubiella] hemipterigena TaxID=1531966 RepID=A0A0A1T1R4_9HYPO|nr:hypothetical protein VHEMI04591 [[Torrubiella] hemipterigena]